MSNNKGQVTLFIIIGIIILISTAIVFYTKSTVIEDRMQSEVLVTEEINTEVEPIRAYVHECLDKIGKQALRRIGLQGGYIDPESLGLMLNPNEPTESDLVEYGVGSFKIPYWWYQDSSNYCSGTCSYATNQPHLTKKEGQFSVEEQIVEYIEENIQFCLNDFKAFRNQGFTFLDIGEVEFDSSVSVRDFRVKMKMPLKVQLGEREHRLSEFGKVYDVNLRKIFELATSIADAQSQYSFIERQTVNLLAAFSDIDKDMLPPLDQTNLEPKGPTHWTKDEVKEDVQNIMSSYITFFSIPGTANFKQASTGSSISDGMYQLFVLPIYSPQGYSYDDVSVDFSYHTWWKPYFDITGRGVSGQVIGPEEGFMDLIPQVILQRYANNYQLSYPVIVELNDHSALNGEGFSLFFALEANVRDNKAMNASFSLSTIPTVQTGSMLCNANQRNSGNVNIITRDGLTGKPLIDVHAAYACGQEECSIGYTFDEGQGAQLNSRFPVCYGGVLTLSKEGYATHSEMISTPLGEEKIIDVTLEKYQDIDLTVMKRRYKKSPAGWVYDPEAMGLLDNEIVFVTFDQVTDTGDGHSEFAVYRPNSTSAIRLVPGTYDVTTHLMYELPAFGFEKIEFPEQEVKTGGIWGGNEFTLPGIEFEGTFYEGGSVMDSTTGRMKVSKSILGRSDSMILYTLSVIDFLNFNLLEHDDLQRMSQINEMSKEHNDDLQPIFG